VKAAADPSNLNLVSWHCGASENKSARTLIISSSCPIPLTNLFFLLFCVSRTTIQPHHRIVCAERTILPLESLQSDILSHKHIMAEAAQGPPTFKLVLVGDGGTGKVGFDLAHHSQSQIHVLVVSFTDLSSSTDNLRQAPSNG
jgi:hypothetical protein